MSLYQNQKYEILIWHHGEDENGCLGDTDQVIGFGKYRNAIKKYLKIDAEVKMLMRYKSRDPDADGDVIEENWRGQND